MSADLSSPLVVRFAGLGFSLEGLAASARAAVSSRFVPTRDEDAPLSIARAGSVVFSRGEAASFPVVDTAGYEETFALAHGQARLRFEGRLCRGEIWLDAGGAEARVEHAPVSLTDMLGVVENVLRMATALVVRQRGGLLLHSAAIAHGDEAIVLVGRSGAGKSTACATALRLGRRVLSDELNALFVEGGTPWVSPVPFAGDFAEPPQDTRLRVRGLFLLEQGGDEVTSAQSTRAAATLLAATPFLNTDPARSDELLEAALVVARVAGARSLALALGSDAWQVATRSAA